MDINLLWLLPLIYAIHIVEEAPRFIPWTRRYPKMFSSRFNVRMFILGNSVFMLYVILSVLLAVLLPGNEWAFTLGLSAAAWTFSNFLLHAVTTLISGVYSPGTVTACVLYAPVSLFIYYAAWQSGMLTPPNVILSILIGFGVMYLPMLLSRIPDKVDLKTTRNPVFKFMLR